jgi:hypothetical protein
MVETDWKLTFTNSGHIFITVCWEQIEQMGTWGKCLKFSLENPIKSIKFIAL